MRKAIRFFLIASAVIFFAVASHSAFASTIDFSTTNGTFSPTSHPSNGSSFSSYTESGFTVKSYSGSVSIDTSGGSAPYLYATDGAISVKATNGGDFMFTGVDLSESEPTEDYTITGFLNGLQVFTTSGALTSSWVLDGTGFSADAINSLVIAVNQDCYTWGNIDNIGVIAGDPSSPVPEPGSLLLLATGLTGVAGLIRRRLTA